MAPEELFFRLSQARDSWHWRMERYLEVVADRMTSAIEQLRSSNAGEHYRALVAALQQVLARLASSRYLQHLVDVARARGKEMAGRMAWASPFLRYWSRDRMALLSVSLAVGLLGGRLLVRPAPRLQPAYMLSTVCGSYSGIGGIAQCRIEVPRICRDTEILVRVMSAGLDRSDLLAVSGWAKAERGRVHGGFTLGRDFCGVVLEAGVGATHLRPGDRVWGAVPYSLPGTFSELLVLPGCMAERMPANLNWDGAATVPYSALQVWSALVWRGGLVPDRAAGYSILVVDGVTDTGCLATQLACLWGGLVTVLCPHRTVPLAHALGAHSVVAARDNVEECLQDLDESGPYQLIVLAGDLLPRAACPPLLAEGGRICSTLPPRLSTDSWGFFRRRFLPLWRSAVSPPHVPPIHKLRQPLQYITRAVEEGKIQIVLDSVLAPQDIKKGLARLAEGETVGKSVVVFDKL